MIQLPPSDRLNCKMYLKQNMSKMASASHFYFIICKSPGQSILSPELFRSREVASVPRCLQWAGEERMSSNIENWTGEYRRDTQKWTVSTSAAFESVRQEEGECSKMPTNGHPERGQRTCLPGTLLERQGLAWCLAHKVTH